MCYIQFYTYRHMQIDSKKKKITATARAVKDKHFVLYYCMIASLRFADQVVHFVTAYKERLLGVQVA